LAIWRSVLVLSSRSGSMSGDDAELSGRMSTSAEAA
jgi:hypothetical protein